MSGKSRAAERASEYKKNIGAEESRRKREDTAVQLRKTKREEQLAKRRQRGGGAAYAAGAGTMAVGGAPAQAPGQPEDLSQYDPATAEFIATIPSLVEGVNSPDPQVVREAVTQFRKLLSIERNPPIQRVINSGVVPKLTSFLAVHTDPKLQLEAAWALTNIASGESVHTRAVVDTNAIPIFVQLLRSQSADVREQAVWGLGNIAGDSPACRDLVLGCGALQPLLALCDPESKLTMLRNVTWTISNLCRGKPQPRFDSVLPCLPVLANLVWSRDAEVLTDACWALSYLSDDTGPNNTKIQAVIQAGVARRVVELLMHPNASVQTPALRTVGNIVTGDDLQTQTIIHCRALPLLCGLLRHAKKGIRKEACWTISNITAGNREQIRDVIEANIIPPLVELLRGDSFDIKKEATWAISNATSGGSEEQIRYLVNQGVIPPLCALFDSTDAKIVMVAMEGIENILRVGLADAQRSGTENKYADWVERSSGVAHLEELQQHPNDEIFHKAAQILRVYFAAEEVDDDPSLAPAVDGQTFSFGGSGAGAPGAGGFNF